MKDVELLMIDKFRDTLRSFVHRQVLYVTTARPQDASTLDGGTSLHIAGGRRDVGQQSVTSMVEAHTATMKPSSGPSRRVSFYSDVHPDIGQLATEIEQIKKVCYKFKLLR